LYFHIPLLVRRTTEVERYQLVEEDVLEQKTVAHWHSMTQHPLREGVEALVGDYFATNPKADSCQRQDFELSMVIFCVLYHALLPMTTMRLPPKNL
jgi:hypothetical protein